MLLTMVSLPHHLLLVCLTLPLLATLLARICEAGAMLPIDCSSQQIKKCQALLYHVNTGLDDDQIASYYSVDPSTFRPISHGNNQDYLIPVPCSCENIGNGTVAYFYDASYTVQKDTRSRGDSLTSIATQLWTNVNDIQGLNTNLTQNPNLIMAGSVLYVPMESDRIPAPRKRRGGRFKWTVLIVVLSVVAFISTIALLIILIRRRKRQKTSVDDPKPVSRSMMSARTSSLQTQFLYGENMEDVTAFESEIPMMYSLREIEEATDNFDETKKIGSGGYGHVYHGILGSKEVAIKKMKSSKSKEFFAELKVLCKVHHINVVELLGFASGDDHLYLVYEYVQNGSLNDHLHDPLLKGHQPLSWTARTQIALDAAKGIEYIHDHTKARYVHRDIKTSNILLDKGLRAKVADFGLVKFVERTNEEDLIATRLVGTPGYLPPESVMELQVTPKSDVFAFGVVLAELITGQRALVRDNKEPNKMRSLITVVNNVFEQENPGKALEEVIDGSLRGSYPTEDVYKMTELAMWCLSDEAVNRPEMRDVVLILSQIVMSSVEWEVSLGGNSQVFSGIYNGR
ncbi:hypothetical protein V6N12_020896 [Hibiscus sabdariffa]|uniref:LysM domain receptor-like kinase 3 n=1 Tax=Hibiscus sabdariffa TaxID=183260 RepID=A0ABR2D248_9ROSI